MMYRMIRLMVLLQLIVAGCGESRDRRMGTPAEPLEDVLTLELTFGAEDLDEEYILARPEPAGVGVDVDGNVLVVDEDYVKVFDSSGHPQGLLGGTGEGPGRLTGPRNLWMSPGGFFTVFDGRTANYFRPDHTWFDRVNFGSTPPFLDVMGANQLFPLGPEVVYCLGESERVYSIDSYNRQNRSRKEIYLFYQDADSLRVLARYPQSNYITGPPRGPTIMRSYLGMLLVAPLPGNRIVYLHTFHDSEITAEGVSYRLTVLDLDSMQKTYLDHQEHPYTPVEITWEPLTYPEEYRKQDPEQWRLTQQFNEIAEAFLAERKYRSPIIHLCTDDRYIFAFTNTRNDSSEKKVDVFDADRQSYLCSAWFSVGSGCIRNGYLYKVNNYNGGDVFPQIEKYRIDQKVYRHR